MGGVSMSVINDSKDYFYLGLQNKKEQIDLLWPGVENLESTQFYELCQKYSDIALNAIKQRIPGTCDVQGCFQFTDIEAAKPMSWVGDLKILMLFCP